MLRILVLVIASHASVSGDPKTDPFLYEKFPADFAWGSATASYQIEGAWNISSTYMPSHLVI